MSISKAFTTVTPFSKLLALLLFIILPIVGFYLGIYYQKNIPAQLPPTQYVPVTKITPTELLLQETPKKDKPVEKDPARDTVFCTQDAKQCPDGRWVGRSGPNCEFICAIPK